MTLLETRERINRTLLEIFQADLAQKFLSRPWLQKVNQICLNQKPRKCLHVAGNSGKSTRPYMKIFKQTLLEVRLSRPCKKFLNRTLLEKFCSVENHNPNKLNEPVKVSEDDLA